jgi:hypothetical protein
MIPTIKARKIEIIDIRKVLRRPSRKKGMYSQMILRLKSSSIL